MTPLPITLAPPALPRIMSGACTVLCRPRSIRWAAVRPGQLLWIREPFHLAAKFNGLSPSAASGLGARPIFATELGVTLPDDVGPRRIPYTLLRQWHRQHLVVTGVRVQHLQVITPAEIEAEGYATRGSYAMAWDQALHVGGKAHADTWEANPMVVGLTFEHVAAALPPDPVKPPSGPRKFVRERQLA